MGAALKIEDVTESVEFLQELSATASGWGETIQAPYSPAVDRSVINVQELLADLLEGAHEVLIRRVLPGWLECSVNNESEVTAISFERIRFMATFPGVKVPFSLWS